jgi:putative ABC transport system permease protein
MLQDIRYAVRTLLKTPGFLLVTVLTLALGIGANTAMFSVIKAVLLSGLPYPRPDQLVQLWETGKGGHKMRASGPNAHDWYAQNRSLQYMAFGGGDAYTLVGGSVPLRINAESVSRDFFRVMGIQAELGRTTGDSDHQPGAAPVVVIGHALWQRGFNGDPNVLGKTVRVDGNAFTIAGVMPPGFDFPQSSEVWVPTELFPDTSTRSAHNYYVWGRLKNGVSLRASQSDMDNIAARLGREYIDDKDHGIRVVSLYEQLVGPVRPALLILLAAVGFVLLIACANLANLQLARGSARAGEMALRAALGAARTRLVRQLLTESILIAIAGGAAGLMLAFWSVGWLRVFLPREIPRLDAIHVDGAVLAFTLAISVAAGVLFGVLPALSASRANVTGALKESSAKSTAGSASRRVGGALVILQTAFAMVLLVGAVLLVETFYNLERVDPGFSTKSLLTAEISWGNDPVKAANLTRRMLDGITTLPGVETAGVTNAFPIKDGGGADGAFEMEGIPLPADHHQYPDAGYHLVTRGYFESLKVTLQRGRLFNPGDEQPGTKQVALVNQAFVREFYGRQDPIGKRIRFLGFDDHPQFLEIVGVVSDYRAQDLKTPAYSEVFAEAFQHPNFLTSTTLSVRGPASAIAPMTSLIQSLDRDVPVNFQSADRLVAESIARQRFQMTLLGIFAALALMLSAVGIYGVQSYTVNRRTNEMGIRLALGARGVDLLHLVLGEGLLLSLAGVALGAAGSVLLTRVLAAFLFQVSATDWLAFTGAAAMLSSFSLAACFLPARRASRTDPMVALRYE